MAAVALKQAGELRQRGKQVKAAVGADEALPRSPSRQIRNVGRQNSLGKARGHDADDALMPVLTRQDDRAVRCAVQAADGLTVNFGFDGLPLAVQAAERFGQPVGLLRVLRQKQAHGQLSLLHTPGGVDTRREYIADGPGSDLLLVAAAGMDQARRPSRCGWRRASRPMTTRRRFSPCSVITSAIVPRQMRSQ